MWKRQVLKPDDAKIVGDALQSVLVDLIDLSLLGKQAHWNLFGKDFLAVHEKLDEVVEAAREGSDAVAERMDQIGIAPDGRVSTVAEKSTLPKFPGDFVEVPDAVSHVCDALVVACRTLRDGQSKVADPDPVTEDLLIGLSETFEEQLWMLQAIEGKDPN